MSSGMKEWIEWMKVGGVGGWGKFCSGRCSCHSMPLYHYITGVAYSCCRWWNLRWRWWRSCACGPLLFLWQGRLINLALSLFLLRSAPGIWATSARGTPCASWPAMSSQSCCRSKGGEVGACTCIGRPTAARRQSDPGTPSGDWAVAWRPPCPGTNTTLTGASPAQAHRGL